MSSTILAPCADAIKAVLEALGYKVHRWLPQQFSAPAAIIELPDIQRVEVEGTEAQLGSDLWQLEYPVSLVFPLREAATAQDRAALAVEQFIRAVDADESLGGVVYEASVISGAVEYDGDQANSVVIYRTRVSVWFFAPTQ